MLEASKENLDRAGIYLLVNRANGKYYVGQSQHMATRMSGHAYRPQDRLHLPLYRAIGKYGWSNFVVIVLEHVDDLAALDKREQYWLDELRPYDEDKGYNIAARAAAPRGWKEDAETIGRKRLRKHSNETRERFKGRQFSDYTRAKMSQNHANVSREANPFWGQAHTLESRRLMCCPRSPRGKVGIARANVLYKGKAVVQIDPDTNEIVGEWPSARQAARAAGINSTYMSVHCNKYPWAKRDGYLWQWRSYYDGGFSVPG